MSGDSHDNYGRIYTSLTNWDATDTPIGTGAYTAGLTGTDSPGGWGATNSFTVNDVAVN